MTTLVLLYGGRSGEHDVSLRSAASVLRQIDPARYRVVPVGIAKSGAWYIQELPDPIPDVLGIAEDASRRVSAVPAGGLAVGGEALAADVALPVLHGTFGEDGTVQGLLEVAGLPYGDSGVLSSAVGMDKELAKRVWTGLGLPVVPWITVRRRRLGDPSLAAEAAETLGWPVFVKPANAGSSVGVSRADGPDALDDALRKAFAHDSKALVEKAVEAREIECSVMGYDEPVSFPPGEVVPAGSHGFYDYDAKYIDPDGALLHVPADLPEDTARTVRSLAERAYQAVEARGFSRVDFLLEKATGKVFLNEINTLPGMTSISLFPRMCAAGGLDYPTVVERIIRGALEEAAERNARSFER